MNINLYLSNYFFKMGLCLILGLLCYDSSIAQDRLTISGYVKDISSGETLLGANVFVKEQPIKGTTSNVYGFYSLSLEPGEYTLVFSYLGYTAVEQVITLAEENLRLNISLREGITIEEVIVTAKEKDNNVSGTEMGTVELPVDQIRKLPALLGEVDILKALQLLPGVMSAGEGNAGFYVRGGGPDQNLVLLDEAIVYNSGHMLGFFSVFNSDAIKGTTLIKGGMPAYYGGRLSSVVDIQMKEGNNQHFKVQGGIGLVASRLTVEGPIQKNKSSFIFSGRRTYAFDLAQPILNETSAKGTNYYFYDFNVKLNHRFSDRDRLFFSAYLGRDIFIYNTQTRGLNFRMPYGNTTATLRWNHLFSDRLFMNASAIINEYEFSFDAEQSDFTVSAFSGVRDYNVKVDFDYFPVPAHRLKFGVNYTFHRLTPNIARASSGDVLFETDLSPKYAHESAIYIQDDIRLTDKLAMNVGLRASLFTQVGPYTSISGRTYDRLEPVKTYWGLEPRVNARWQLDAEQSLKGSVTLGRQYLHLVSNSSTTLPTDIWVPSSEKVKPQVGIQYAVGYFRNFLNDRYEGAIEVYYRDLKNQIDYGESYVNDITREVEDDFVFGTGRSYGVELFLKKRYGDFNGWLGYTLSRTERTFPDIRNGETFPARYDRTHDLSLVANYKLNPQWEFGVVVVYGTGNAFTPLESFYFVEQRLQVEYGPRNSDRLPAYHRMDLSATLTPKKRKSNNFFSTWTFSIYNSYNRFNPFFIFYWSESNIENGNAQAFAYKVSLFPIIPSVTWNFKWNSQKEKTPDVEPLIETY